MKVPYGTLLLPLTWEVYPVASLVLLLRAVGWKGSDPSGENDLKRSKIKIYEENKTKVYQDISVNPTERWKVQMI